MSQYDLVVCYRIYPRISKHPPIFSDDKLKLSELCLSSFKNSLEGLKVKMIVILDGCPETYKGLFEKYFHLDDLIFYEVNSIGNAATFKMQMDLLLEQNFSENIYFAEDDYFYKSDKKFKNLIEFMNNNENVDFVTPYFHLDYITMEAHLNFKSQKKKFNSEDFVTVATTTMTFLTTKSKMKSNYQVFFSYAKKNDDASVWLSLTKHKVANIFLLIKYFFKDKLWFKMYFKNWIYNKWQILFGKKYNLWCPVESYSTHMDDKYLAPDIDWENEFKLQLEKIDFVK